MTLKEKTRAELYRNVDADYYGYRDEEDGTLLEFENEQEDIGMTLGGLCLYSCLSLSTVVPQYVDSNRAPCHFCY